MNSKQPIHLVLNATSLRPGGGLTVLLGVLDGLALQPDIDLQATVICSAQATHDAIIAQGVATDVILKCVDAGLWKRQYWVNMKMGKFVNSLNPDIFLTINQFVSGVSCPQAVYHLNLLRFMPIDSNANWKHRIAEWIRNRSSALALKKAEANVFESQYLMDCADKIHACPRERAHVIYIGLPDGLHNVTPSDEPTKTYSNSQIISITNHNDHKDNPTLIRLLASLHQRYPNVDWRLKIAGSLFPERWAPFKELATELNVGERIEWLGFLEQNELTDHLQQSLCLVSTSRVESFCMVALESMARGCPAIVANAAAMPESVADAAVLIEPGDHDGFADAISTFQQAPDARQDFVDFGFERIKEFRWENCGRQFGDLLKKLLRQSQD